MIISNAIKWCLLTSFLIIVGNSCKTTQTNPNETITPSQKEISDKQEFSLENSLLWKIKSPQATDKESYLYGTIHIIGAEDFFLPDGTLAAIDATEKMVFEINMEDMNDMSAAMGLMQKAFMKDNLTLKDLLSEEEYGKVEAHFKKMGFPLMFFERIKPMFLTVFASGDMNPMDMQSGKVKSYEMEFMKIAKDANKTFDGLETIEFQMSVFDSIPYKDQAKMLVESIGTADTGSDQFKEMVDIYKKQDLNAMMAMFAQEESGLEDYNDLLLNGRNKNWIPVMKKMISEKSTFFAVGAGHLGGESGVINLLRKEGYKLTPIKSKKI